MYLNHHGQNIRINPNINLGCTNLASTEIPRDNKTVWLSCEKIKHLQQFTPLSTNSLDHLNSSHALDDKVRRQDMIASKLS